VEKVVRGGSYVNQPFFARSVHRLSAVPTTTVNDGVVIGFRCAADVDANAANNALGGGQITIGGTQLPAIEGTLDPLQLGRLETPGNGGSVPGLPTLSVSGATPIATLLP
jgi:hypothetical protein